MKFITINEDRAREYHALITDAYASTLALGINFKASTVSIDEIILHLQSTAVYGIEMDGQLVSTLSIRFPWSHNPAPYRYPHLGWLATGSQYKKQGLNLKLYNWVEENILKAQLRAPSVTLGTAKSHPWLVEFYQKIGFKEIGTAELGRGHTTIYMEKFLQH